MAPRRNDQLANLYFNPPISGYEQMVILIMDIIRQNWRNLEEVELVEDTWREKLVQAGALPQRQNDKYIRLRHIVDKTCFGVKYDRKNSAKSAFTIYTPLKCYADNFSALAYIRSIILRQVPELLEARTKGIEYEAEFLQTELLRELQRMNLDIPDCLLRYTRYMQELIHQHKGKLILDKSGESDDPVCVSMDTQQKPVIDKKEVLMPQFLEIPSKVSALYRKQCLPKGAAEAERKMKLFIIYKMLVSSEHSGVDVPDEVLPEHEEDPLVEHENVLICQFSKIMKHGQISYDFHNCVLNLGNRDYTFKTCKLRLSLSSSLDLEAIGIRRSDFSVSGGVVSSGRSAINGATQYMDEASDDNGL